MDSGSAGGGSGEDQDISDPQRKKKRYHRHTARQIQELESIFKECPHPDEKQRMQLSRDLGLEPRQIKFWFQNRRTQMKAQHERADNCALRAENDKIRCENIAIREALKNVICPSCGGPPVGDDCFFDEQKLRMENARLKEELDRVSSIAAKYIGRPISRLPSIHPIPSSLDLSVGSFGNQGMTGPSLDLDLLPSSSVPPLALQASGITDMDKTLMAEIATNAMEELIRVSQNDAFWIKSPMDGRDMLSLENYERSYPRANNMKTMDMRLETSRDSGMVIMNALSLVDIFMDSSKFAEMFPTIVSEARTIDILAPGVVGSRNESLVLMYEVLQVLSPLVPTREFYILRYCRQIDQGMWAVVDVSFDFSRESQFVSPSLTRKRPSGCLIQDMPNGYSKVLWVEHVEIEEKNPSHRLYRDLVNSGVAFGAERWLTTLQRMCERFACLMVNSTSARDIGGVIHSPDSKRSLMKLAQRMINNFCASISASNSGHRWTTLSGLNDVGVRVTVHKSTDPGQPNGVVLSAATSIWLPISSQNVFNFFRDERTRAQWDVLSDGNPVEEVCHIANGPHPGNCISVLRSNTVSQNNMLMLQESCIDSSGSVVVYAPVDLHSINLAMSGEDPSYIPLLPSGFTICPDGRPDQGGASTSSMQSSLTRSGGSLLTVAFQILVSSLPSAKLNLESVTTVNNLISTTVHNIKAALNCPGS